MPPAVRLKNKEKTTLSDKKSIIADFQSVISHDIPRKTKVGFGNLSLNAIKCSCNSFLLDNTNDVSVHIGVIEIFVIILYAGMM